MLSENLKAIRRSKGLSQEAVAAGLHVIRQTVSKWERGLSVPDSDTLLKLADLFEVPVSELLGAELNHEGDRNELAEQLSNINGQLAIKNRRARRIWRVVVGILIAIAVYHLVLVGLSMVASVNYENKGVTHVTTQPVESIIAE